MSVRPTDARAAGTDPVAEPDPDAGDDAVPSAAAFPIILSGPSGAGKTTIRDRLLAAAPDEVLFSVSVTTREPRAGERDGEDYRFISRRDFLERVEGGELLEHAEVHGELYGTPAENLERAREREVHLLLDVDVQGARQVRSAVPRAVSIFILPPDAERILRRLRRRGSESAEQLERRLISAEAELEAVGEFDYVLINDDLEAAVDQVRQVMGAERLALSRIRDEARVFATRLAREIRDATR